MSLCCQGWLIVPVQAPAAAEMWVTHPKILNVLLNHYYPTESLQILSDTLGTPAWKYYSLTWLNYHDPYSLIREIMHSWKSRVGIGATVAALEVILSDLNAQDCAGKYCFYNLPTREPSSVSGDVYKLSNAEMRFFSTPTSVL